MKHKGTMPIRTQRLVLRPFTAEDVPAVFQNWGSDERVTEFLRWPAHQTADVTKEVIADWVSHYHESNFYQWAIVKQDIGEPIGSIGAVGQDEALGILHIGYCIGSRWWHQGITSEAFAAVIAFLFEQVGANRIESQHDPRNPNSGKVMKKCGLKYEGTLRQADFNNKGICDAAVYGLLAEEYYENLI